MGHAYWRLAVNMNFNPNSMSVVMSLVTTKQCAHRWADEKLITILRQAGFQIAKSVFK